MMVALGYSDLRRPTDEVFGQYFLLVSFFIFGAFFCRVLFTGQKNKKEGLLIDKTPRYICNLFVGLGVVAFAFLILSLYLSGAFYNSFHEYFLKLRLHGLDGYLTGFKYIDLLTKIIIFPFSYFLFIFSLAVRDKKIILARIVALSNIFAFAYLWQVNYPFLYLFWILIFAVVVNIKIRAKVNKRMIFFILLIFSILFLAAINRVDMDLLVAIDRYFYGYHIIGFSFYDYHYNDLFSNLHDHSFGRSSLGFIDQSFDLILRIFGGDFKAASFENTDFNMSKIDLGKDTVRSVNGFGTLLYSFYRDFGYAGIIVGGFLYGFFIAHAFLSCRGRWKWRALVMLLASSWMMGMMVSPMEQPYFWFSIICIVLTPKICMCIHGVQPR